MTSVLSAALLEGVHVPPLPPIVSPVSFAMAVLQLVKVLPVMELELPTVVCSDPES